MIGAFLALAGAGAALTVVTSANKNRRLLDKLNADKAKREAEDAKSARK